MKDMKYLQKRGDQWHYVRRVPKKYREIDPRGMIRNSLGTDSLTKARKLRTAQAEKEDQIWKLEAAGEYGDKTAREQADFQKAQIIAKSLNLNLIDVEALAKLPVDNILNRLSILENNDGTLPDKEKADSLLGTTKRPEVSISEAFELYFDKIAVGQLLGKSDSQKKNWYKPKRRAIMNFIEMHGDITMGKINREHATDFSDWWGERLNPGGTEKPMAPNTANRDIGNLRKFYREYWEYVGEEERKNPFRNMRFKNIPSEPRPPFEDSWVRDNILRAGVFDGLNFEAKLLVYALIETGCRPSELANIQPQNIKLDDDVPHICIRYASGRQLKARASERDIPLVGISLLAMRQAPNGFPRYRDKDALLSASLMKAFRARKLFPTPDHKIYSLRHSFEKRMLEAGLDYGLRCTLLGHKDNRPAYGDGGAMAYRRDELLKIVHPVDPNFAL